MTGSNQATALKQVPIPFGLDDLPFDQTVKGKYAYWRLRLLYAMFIGYAALYLVRLNFSMAIPLIGTELGYSKTDLGWVLTAGSIVYGVGKLMNGYFSDRSDARYFMSIGIMGAAITSFFMGFGSSLIFFGIFWASSNWFQSMGWPPISRLLTHWFSPRELGTKWGITQSSAPLGGAVIAVLAGYLIHNYGWRSAFFVPAIIVMLVGLFVFNRLRDTPASMELPPIEEFSGIKRKSAEGPSDEDYSPKELVFSVLSNRLLWYVCLANMFLYVVRMGVFNWAPTFLMELKGASTLLSGWQLAGFEIAGVMGGIGAGWMSDRLFDGRRGPVSVLYMVVLTGCLSYFWFVPEGSAACDALVMMAVGFLVYGPQTLVGVAAADFASKKAVGMAVGLTGTFGYLGAGLSGVCVGWMVDHYGWNGGFIFFILSALMGTLFFALTWHHRARVLEETVSV